MSTTTLAVTLAAVVLGGPPKIAPDFVDGFGDGSAVDGSPAMWTASPAFGADFEIIDGDMVISIDAGSPAISSPRVDNYFASGASVRARMLAVDGPGRYTVAFADQETGIKGYVASFSTCLGGRVELFRGDVLGQIVHLGPPVPMPYSPVDGEFYVQLDVFEGVVSARVWRPGEAFPEPQISAPDDTYADGVMSIAIQDFGSGTSCGLSGDTTDTTTIVRFAQASSNPLTSSGRGDLNLDGSQDFSDVILFLTAFGDMGDAADLAEPTGQWDFSDVVAFLTYFAE